MRRMLWATAGRGGASWTWRRRRRWRARPAPSRATRYPSASPAGPASPAPSSSTSSTASWPPPSSPPPAPASPSTTPPPPHPQLFHRQNLTFVAAWPGLFVDKKGTYWDVPLSLALDLSSVSSSSGFSYHLFLQHKSGDPKCFGGDETDDIPVSLLPGLCAKVAMSIKKSIDLWRKKEDKLKQVQPYDVLLSDPHVSVTGIIGAVASASFGNCSKRVPVQDGPQRSNAFRMFDERNKFSAFADLIASVTFTTQLGNFQRPLLDLTRVSARLDISSGSLFLQGASRLAQDFFYS